MSIQRKTLTRNVTDRERDIIRIAMSSFVSCFIPRDVVLDIGLPIREFFLWSDDWEYTRRISGVYPCYLVTASTVLHDMEINSGADISTASEDALDKYRKLYRNDVYLYRREGLKGFCYEAIRLAYHMAKIAVRRNSVSSKCKRMAILIKGTREGIGFYPVPDRVMPKDAM